MASSLEWQSSTHFVDFETAETWMRRRVIAIQENEAPECAWLLEHPPLYTAGTSAKPHDLLDSRFPVYTTGRGGQYTYHGPGQRICYMMLDLSKRKKDLRLYITMLEEWGIQTLKKLGIEAYRHTAGVGLWVDTQKGPAKIAALGVRISKWVTSHGIAFNIYPNLAHYQGIVPCGLSGSAVTSAHALGSSLPLEEFDNILKQTFFDIPFFTMD